MTDKQNDKSAKPQTGEDSEDSLQKELNRESTEGRDSIGDVGSNRTLSGSSTWETTPAKNQSAAPRKDKHSG
jgi:hypothetical protein